MPCKVPLETQEQEATAPTPLSTGIAHLAEELRGRAGVGMGSPDGSTMQPYPLLRVGR